jgi:hypothetical protein
MLVRSLLLEKLGCALMLLTASACASGGDAASRQLGAISRVTAPSGSLAISDDGGYSFVDSSKMRETHGKLSPSQLDEVEARVAEPRLSKLYGFRAEDDACEGADDGYFLQSRLGTACFVTSSLTDSSARADLDFFRDLYEDTAE